MSKAAYFKKYDQSEKGKARRRRYITSEKGHQKYRLRISKYVEMKQNFITNFKAQVGCKECRIDDPVVLDFHHPEEKRERWRAAYSSWQVILNHCKECIILCANHHRWTHEKIN